MIPKKMYYVTMTDKFMSGWGKAKDKINKYVIGCNTYQEAYFILCKALVRPEMKYVNICSTKPRYKPDYYEVTYVEFNELSGVWKKGWN